MKLATLRFESATVAVRIDAEFAVEIPGFGDVGVLLANTAWHQMATEAAGPRHALGEIAPKAWAPVVPHPSKVVCVGLNYANHIREMGRELPEFPTLFAKYPEALIGPYDDIVVPSYASEAVDWEAELAVVVGRTARRLTEQQSARAIAGYSVINDVTMRDYQYRSPEWMQGKTFEASSPFGPFLLTAEDFQSGTELSTVVDGEKMQSTLTDDLVFSPEQLVSYISHIVTLNPGDVIATGTPGGVGHARNPARYLRAGQLLTTTIEGLGQLANRILVEG